MERIPHRLNYPFAAWSAVSCLNILNLELIEEVYNLIYIIKYSIGYEINLWGKFEIRNISAHGYSVLM